MDEPLVRVAEHQRRRFGILAGGLVHRVEVIRLVFGVVWAIDAYYKWRPAFISGFASNVAASAQDQPRWLGWWFRFWLHAVHHDPRVWAYATAVVETLIAASLILGIGRRVLYIAGALYSLGIWTVAEGFGGALVKGATDVGTAIMYTLLSLVLYGLETLPTATGAWSLDHRIERRFPWWCVIAEPGQGRAG